MNDRRSDDNAEAQDQQQAEPGADRPDLASRVRELESTLASTNDRLLRALADQENVRRRADRDREEALKFASSDLVRDLLPSIDNLRRAIESVPDADRADEISRHLLAGVEAIERGILDTLEKHGIRRIDPLGRPFDPRRHQAMFEQRNGEHPPGTVVQVLQPGYTHHDRLLRPAMVSVASAGGDRTLAEPDMDSRRE